MSVKLPKCSRCGTRVPARIVRTNATTGQTESLCEFCDSDDMVRLAHAVHERDRAALDALLDERHERHEVYSTPWACATCKQWVRAGKRHHCAGRSSG
jgi:hypothetical protein